ncbi:hypothetical protein [Radiobacillus sp. PE A8.2]|uniref:hypothetical protein n=1 Tax=Radiobacillus sp. PE A8.2 TaxID=3380349 RepID=UPI00388F5A16
MITTILIILAIVYLIIGLIFAVRFLLTGWLDGMKTFFFIVFCWLYLALTSRRR